MAFQQEKKKSQLAISRHPTSCLQPWKLEIIYFRKNKIEMDKS